MSDYELKPELPDPAPEASPSTPVLPYRSPADRVHTNTLAVLPAVLGFLAALGLSAAAFILFASTYRERVAVKLSCFFGTGLAFVVLFVVRSFLQQRFGFSGFGRGLIIGTVVGLIGLVPCAGMYLLFMQVK